MNRKKQFIIFILILSCSLGKAQKLDSLNHCDTIIVLFKNYSGYERKFLSRLMSAYYNGNDTLFFYIKPGMVRKRIPGSTYVGISSITPCQHVYRFVTRKDKLIAMGMWGGECFYNWYREYYKNGKVMKIGYYDCCGHKEKTWQFFNNTGLLIREEVYSKDSLMKTINY